MGEERCTHVKAMVFANKAMATRSNLEREAGNWLREAGTTPPGNGGKLAFLQSLQHGSGRFGIKKSRQAGNWLREPGTTPPGNGGRRSSSTVL